MIKYHHNYIFSNLNLASNKFERIKRYPVWNYKDNGDCKMFKLEIKEYGKCQYGDKRIEYYYNHLIQSNLHEETNLGERQKLPSR